MQAQLSVTCWSLAETAGPSGRAGNAETPEPTSGSGVPAVRWGGQTPVWVSVSQFMKIPLPVVPTEPSSFRVSGMATPSRPAYSL